MRWRAWCSTRASPVQLEHLRDLDRADRGACSRCCRDGAGGAALLPISVMVLTEQGEHTTLRHLARREVIELMAGYYAEGRLRHWTHVVSYFKFHANQDGKRAWEALEILTGVAGDGSKHGPREWWGVLQELSEKAWALVRVHWPAITALAEALLAKGELSDEIKEIVAGSMPAAFPKLRAQMAETATLLPEHPEWRQAL